jgi:4-hydroxybenzoate polyprenyltransferase
MSPIKSHQIRNEFANALIITVLLAALAVALMPETAFAQGQGEALLQYTYEEYGRPMLNMAIVAAAITMFFLRFSFPVIGMVAAGGLTFANYEAIAALFGA